MNLLLEPLNYEFMRFGMIAAALVGVACASIGVYVVLRRMAFIGDALAHTILPGVVGAYLMGANLLLGALVAGLLTALGIGWFSRRGDVREDTAIGIVFTGMFALGILMMSTVQSFRDFTHILFGNILGVTGVDLALIAGVCALILAGLWLFNKELELTSYDPVHSEVIGLRTDWVRYGLLILLALTVITGIQVVGVVMTSALLITPAATSALLTNRLSRMVPIAAGIAVVCGIAGLYLSYYFAVSSGAAIVLLCTLSFAIAWLVRQVSRPRAIEEAA